MVKGKRFSEMFSQKELKSFNRQGKLIIYFATYELEEMKKRIKKLEEMKKCKT